MHQLDRAQTQIHTVLRRTQIQFALFVALGMLLLTACTDPQAQAQFEQFLALNQTALAAQSVEPGNRLLIQDVDSNLYSIRPDGSARQAITKDATSLRRYTQPTWSPSGERIAWAEVNLRGEEPTSSLIVAEHNGLRPVRYETPFVPFYINWSPDGDWIAYLSNWVSLNQPTLALRLVDLQADPSDAESSIRTLVEGQPLYFSWAPDSSRLLAHISNERIEYRSVEGEGEAIALSPAQFPAPQWSDDGSRLLYAEGSGSSQRLVLTEAATAANVDAQESQNDASQSITDFDESITFAMNAAGDRIAYVVSPTEVGTAAFGPLYIYEIDSRRTRAIGDAPVIAYFWSPDGNKLAYLMLEADDEALQVRWHVWDGTRSQPYAAIIPSRTFLTDYLAFFDQYARSMTIWSPDSNAFAYAAVDPTTGSRIWVQDLDAEKPDNIDRGVFVTWSPR